VAPSVIKCSNSLSCSPAYVGLATIAGFVWWFVYADTGPKLPYKELVSLFICLFVFSVFVFLFLM